MSKRHEVRGWRRLSLLGEEPTREPFVPTSAMGHWLQTGPDTMLPAARELLSRLKLFWFAKRNRLSIAARLGRQGFIEYVDDRFPPLSMLVYFAPELVQRIAYDNQPFLAFLPKRKAFAAEAVA